jgi:hypothetical protein
VNHKSKEYHQRIESNLLVCVFVLGRGVSIQYVLDTRGRSAHSEAVSLNNSLGSNFTL